MRRMKWFADNYIPTDKQIRVLDVGSYNVNGCYRTLFNGTQVQYQGLDMVPGPNVDIVPKDPYAWAEISDNSYDFVISGNAFEHIEYPWLTIKEIARVLRPKGFVCILTPFAYKEHKYPTDCYRYFSDGFIALAKWADLNVIEATVGGVPQGTTDPAWKITEENYDDTVLIAGKDLTAKEIKKSPKFGSTHLVHNWS